MTIELRCDCGELLRAKDEWAGRKAKCRKCGRPITIPQGQDPPPPRADSLGDLLDENLSPQLTAPASSPSPTPAPQGKRSTPRRGWSARLFGWLPGLPSRVMSWREPACARIRLQGDLLLRVAVSLAIWAAGTGLLCLYIAHNTHEPGLWVAFGFGLIGSPGLMVMFIRRHHVSGTVHVQKDDITRHYSYFSLGIWHACATWPYEAIDNCVIVPHDVLGKSFSVMLLDVDSEIDLIAIPKSVDLQRLQQHIDSRGVPVEFGRSIPPLFRKGIDPTIATVFSVICAVFFFVGLGYYIVQVCARDDQPAEPGDVRRLELEESGKEMAPSTEPGLLNGPPATRRPLGGRAEPQSPQTPRADSAAPKLPNRPTSSRQDIGAASEPRNSGPAVEPSRSDAASQQTPDEQMQPSPRDGFQPPGFGLPRSIRATSRPGASRPGTRHVPASLRRPGDTGLAGGSGGIPFRTTAPNGKPVVGFQYSLGSWAGTQAIGKLEPLFDRNPPNASLETVLAREGYAVGAIRVHADDLVHALQIVFMRATSDGLDPSDSYTSEFHASAHEKWPTLDNLPAKRSNWLAPRPSEAAWRTRFLRQTVVRRANPSSPLKKWGTFPTCLFSSGIWHVGNVPHVFFNGP